MKLNYSRLTGLTALLCCALRLSATLQAAPTASVTGVSVTPNPLCTADSGASVSATIGASFDADSSTTLYSSFTVSAGLFGSTRYRTKTITNKVYTNQQVSVAANGGVPTVYPLGGGSPPYSFSQGITPSAGDGIKTGIVTAQASETETATPTTYTEYWSGNGQSPGGILLGTSVGTVGAPTITMISSSTVQGSANYVVDLVAPVAFLWPNNNGQNPEQTIQQSKSLHPHVKITGGSAGQSYTLTAIATAPDASTKFTSVESGTFGAKASGIANDENQVWTLPIPCSAPLGQYTLSIEIRSNDLCGNAWPVQVMDAGTFTVTPGLNISAQSFIVAQLPDGSYAYTNSFTNVFNRKTLANNTNPGSFHATTAVTTAGPCRNYGTFTPTALTITLDPAFAFADTGSSPRVHVFVGDGSAGYNLNSGDPLVEVTLPSVNGIDLAGRPTVTVDLSSLGALPSNWTIYARAHCRLLDGTKPDAGTVYTFSAGATTLDLGDDFSSTSTLTLSSVTQTGGGK